MFLLGIEVKFKNQDYPLLIAPTHIPELNVVEQDTAGVTFGASVSLLTLEEVAKEIKHHLPGKWSH